MAQEQDPQASNAMNLGAFSISLSVKDLATSKQFYQKLGFSPFAGDESANFLLLRNGDHVIGLFEGMFEGNLLTFNPGWDQEGQDTEQFTDIRQLQRQLEASGIDSGDAIDSPSGPASLMITDPDGNTILLDQHRS